MWFHCNAHDIINLVTGNSAVHCLKCINWLPWSQLILKFLIVSFDMNVLYIYEVYYNRSFPNPVHTISRVELYKNLCYHLLSICNRCCGNKNSCLKQIKRFSILGFPWCLWISNSKASKGKLLTLHKIEPHKNQEQKRIFLCEINLIIVSWVRIYLTFKVWEFCLFNFKKREIKALFFLLLLLLATP